MKTGLISKLIKMCIVVLIPLLASVGVGFYGYQYYQFRFFDHYMEKASDENTEDRLISYLSYINEKLDYSKEGENTIDDITISDNICFNISNFLFDYFCAYFITMFSVM